MKAKTAAILVVVAAFAAGLWAQAALATPPVDQTREVLAQSAIALRQRISAPVGTDVVVTHLTFAPRGISGWHAHPGATVVLVKPGIFNLYRGGGSV
jgi:hypothetical protein